VVALCVKWEGGRLSVSSLPQQGQIQKINAAYDALSDAHARVKYDFEHFGTSTSPDLGNRVAHPHGNYKAMTGQDVDDMFSGLNSFERFSTAKYHAMRSAKAPAAVGRRATGFHERKQFRAAQLPTKNASLAWLGFPVVIVALWAFNLKNFKKDAQRESRLR
jgi:curved DNA-binding protein CbpA